MPRTHAGQPEETLSLSLSHCVNRVVLLIILLYYVIQRSSSVQKEKIESGAFLSLKNNLFLDQSPAKGTHFLESETIYIKP